MSDVLISTIIGSILALIIALFVKYGIKPKIEIVYETNRKLIIRRLLVDVFNVSNQFNNAFDIFDRQDNFEPDEQVSYDLTINEVAGLEHIHDYLMSIYEPLEMKREVLLQHLTIREYEFILGFIGSAVSFFAIPGNAVPNNGIISVLYLPNSVSRMRWFGWEIINLHPQIRYEFIQNMRRYDGL